MQGMILLVSKRHPRPAKKIYVNKIQKNIYNKENGCQNSRTWTNPATVQDCPQHK
jgi:hypothetical protein